MYDGEGLVHLDARSRVVWATANRAHHEARWRPDGRVLVLTRVIHAGEGPQGRSLYEDFVAELAPDGRELRRVSVLEALKGSRWAALLGRAPPDTGDLLHTNALYPLDEMPPDSSGLMGPGRVLLSMRHIGALAVLDLDRKELLWASVGSWQKQHDAELTPTGAMMLFDNRGGVRGTSRVLMMDPWTMRIRWMYAGTAERPLLSEVLGSSQELPGGNLLITESTRGRAIEVTPDGDVVWEFRNPERAGPNR